MPLVAPSAPFVASCALRPDTRASPFLLWCGAMMLDHLGEGEAAASMVRAIETVLATPAGRTRDLQGSADTAHCGKAIAGEIG